MNALESSTTRFGKGSWHERRVTPVIAHRGKQDTPSTRLLYVTEPLDLRREPRDAVIHRVRPRWRAISL